MNNDLHPRKKGFIARYFSPSFENIGSKIKTLCCVLYWILLISMILFGVVCAVIGIINISYSSGLPNLLTGIAVILISPLVAKLISISLYGFYGFGELIETCGTMSKDIKAIRRQLENTPPSPPAPQQPPAYAQQAPGASYSAEQMYARRRNTYTQP